MAQWRCNVSDRTIKDTESLPADETSPNLIALDDESGTIYQPIIAEPTEPKSDAALAHQRRTKPTVSIFASLVQSIVPPWRRAH
jgi:hypothetical protein